MSAFKNEFTYRRLLDGGKEEEFDALFEGAVAEVKRTVLGKRFPMWIGGKEEYASEELLEMCSMNPSIQGSCILSWTQRRTLSGAVTSAIRCSH